MGMNANSLWHVYVTLQNPISCPILALTNYLFSNPGILTPFPNHISDWEPTVGNEFINPNNQGLGIVSCIGYIKPFPRCNQYDILWVLQEFIIDIKVEFQCLGIKDGDWGSHFARKALQALFYMGKLFQLLLFQFAYMQYGVWKQWSSNNFTMKRQGKNT